MLKNLVASATTDVSQLVKLASDDRYQNILPSALSDELLLSLTRDLGLLNQENVDDQTLSQKLTAPLYLVSRLSVRKYKDAKKKASFNNEDLNKAFSWLQIALERELLSRITGVNDAPSDEQFLECLDNCLSQGE